MTSSDLLLQIKWQDKAYYHSTWEEYDSISSCKGFRKLDNYFKSAVITDMHYHYRQQEDPEEFEQHMVARETERETLLDYHIVERVIDSRPGEDGTEYYVKCRFNQTQPLFR